MSDNGPYSRTRAASRNASRESTPTRANQTSRDGRATRDNTPATARRAGGRANRVAPTAHDGDDALPPVANKNSKAYGSAGKLKGPVEMDFDQTQQHPELALNTALAQSHARAAGLLPTLAETTNESEPQVEHQSSTISQHDQQISTSQHGEQTVIESHENRTLAGFDHSAWAPGSGGSRLFQSFKKIFHGVAQATGTILLWFARFFANLNPLDILFWFMVLYVIYIASEVAYGPLLWFDSPFASAIRKGLNAQNGTEANLGGSRIHMVENRLSIVERIVHNFFSKKSKADTPPRINWFEIGQGAVIDPYYSSPAYVSEVHFTLFAYIASLFTFNRHALRPIAFSQGPTEALMHWNDGGLDRYCAPSSRGKLQLTVNVARPIAPQELIIEHIAKGATIFVGMAPREVELWIEVHDEIAFFELEQAISASQPSLLENSSPQAGKELAPAQALPSTFLPIARFFYDVHGNQAVQSFAVPFDLAAMGIKTSRILFRANSNWGSYDATCINRLRLHAIDMSGEEEEMLEPALVSS